MYSKPPYFSTSCFGGCPAVKIAIEIVFWTSPEFFTACISHLDMQARTVIRHIRADLGEVCV